MFLFLLVMYDINNTGLRHLKSASKFYKKKLFFNFQKVFFLHNENKNINQD